MQGWIPEMTSRPRCNTIMRNGEVCVKPVGHPGKKRKDGKVHAAHMSAIGYRAQRERMDAFRASLGAQSLIDYDPVKLLRWGSIKIMRKRREWVGFDIDNGSVV